MIYLFIMTKLQKQQLREQVNALADSMYKAIVDAYELVEKDMPSSIPEEQKQTVFTQIFNTSFETQMKLLEATISDVKGKVKDSDFMSQFTKGV